MGYTHYHPSCGVRHPFTNGILGRVSLLGVLAIVLCVPGCNAVAQREFFSARTQEPDGRWSAARFGGKQEADLRVSSLMLLALLGSGNSQVPASQVMSLRRGLRWIRGQVDSAGRFGLRADADWALDHAIATYCTIESSRLLRTKDETSPEVLLSASDAMCRGLVENRPVASIELRLWARMCAVSLEMLANEFSNDKSHVIASTLYRKAAVIADVIAGLAPAAPATERDKAANELLSVLLRPSGVQDGWSHLEWPAEPLGDPMTTFYLTAASWLRGGDDWRSARELVKRKIIDQQVRDHHGSGVSLSGSWDPVGCFGEENGRLGTTAVCLLIMSVYYRYCALSVAR